MRPRRLGVGFCLGYAEKSVDDDGATHRFNTQILVGTDGIVVGKYRKVHIPGHEHNEEWRPFQHAERHFFEPGTRVSGVGGIWRHRRNGDLQRPPLARDLSGDGSAGSRVDLDRIQHPALLRPRSPAERSAGVPQPPGDAVGCLSKRRLCRRRRQRGSGGGGRLLAQTVIIAPSGQIVAQCITTGDEVVVAKVDLDYCDFYKKTLFDFDRYRVPEAYRLT